MRTKDQIVKQHAEAYVNEFAEKPDDGFAELEWTGTGFAELSREEQNLFGSWSEFHELISEAAIETCDDH